MIITRPPWMTELPLVQCGLLHLYTVPAFCNLKTSYHVLVLVLVSELWFMNLINLGLKLFLVDLVVKAKSELATLFNSNLCTMWVKLTQGGE